MEATLSASSSITKTSALGTIGQYFLAGIMSLIAACLVLQIWSFDHLFSCMDYSCDSLFYAMAIKSTITSGWYLTNPLIGVPDGYSLVDFPMPDGLSFLFIKVLTFFSSDWVFVQNAFFLLTFPLAAMTALFVFKRLGLKYPLALTGSLLYSLLPYHFLRGINHLLLSAYFIVPLAIWLAILIYQNKLFDQGKGVFFFDKKKLSLYFFICLLVGSTGIYYAYFGCFFILVAGCIASYAKKKFFPLVHAALLVGVICLSVLINLWPTISYQFKHGKNHEVAQRSMSGTECFGLKISQLLLPIEHDRIKLMERIRRSYDRQTPLNNENACATLGGIAGLGFVFLIGRIFFRRQTANEEDGITKDALSHFTIAGVLLATIGGFSTFIAMSVLPGIRAYNRISVFLAFFALAAFFLFLQECIKKRGLQEGKKIIWSISLILLAFGIFNQTSRTYGVKTKRESIDLKYRADKALVEQIEAVLPAYSKIFQLPYMFFPENYPPPGDLYSYDHFRASLCSNTLKWSFGAIKGRTVDKWQKATASYPVAEMVDELVGKGFSGIYLNRLGYQDRGAEIEAQLAEILQVTPISNAEISFWDLRPYVHESKRSQLGSE